MLTREICDCLEIEPGMVEVKRFSDGETFVQIIDNVRGADVYVVQSTSTPANENLMELLLIIDAAKRASANRITAVTPYFGYARQDRKEKGRVPISAKLVANLITTAGADRLLGLDLHSGQIQGFFDVPVDHLQAHRLFLDFVKERDLTRNLVVVSPDLGSVKGARSLAESLRTPLAIVDKRRPQPNVSEVMNVIGEELIQGRDVMLLDDMIDTAGTICNASIALRERGARDIYVFATHGVFSGPALERLEAAPITEVVVSNSIQHDRPLPAKIRILSVAPLLAEAIQRIHLNRSISELFRQTSG
jgi:ribose-phosphate pyrophosphokinase